MGRQAVQMETGAVLCCAVLLYYYGGRETIGRNQVHAVYTRFSLISAPVLIGGENVRSSRVSIRRPG